MTSLAVYPSWGGRLPASQRSWMFTWRCSCSPSRPIPSTISSSGGICRGGKWLTTKTAVLKWLEQSAGLRATAAQERALAQAIARGDTTALVDAVHTGTARLGINGQPAAR